MGRCLPVAVVVVVLLVVEAAVLEGLVPFLVPVTNSICETNTSECQLEVKHFIHHLIQFKHILHSTFGHTLLCLNGDIC